jgi:hypothetical protein
MTTYVYRENCRSSQRREKMAMKLKQNKWPLKSVERKERLEKKRKNPSENHLEDVRNLKRKKKQIQMLRASVSFTGKGLIFIVLDILLQLCSRLILGGYKVAIECPIQ